MYPVFTDLFKSNPLTPPDRTCQRSGDGPGALLRVCVSVGDSPHLGDFGVAVTLLTQLFKSLSSPNAAEQTLLVQSTVVSIIEKKNTINSSTASVFNVNEIWKDGRDDSSTHRGPRQFSFTYVPLLILFSEPLCV